MATAETYATVCWMLLLRVAAACCTHMWRKLCQRGFGKSTSLLEDITQKFLPQTARPSFVYFHATATVASTLPKWAMPRNLN